jgi:hypothetical protein
LLTGSAAPPSRFLGGIIGEGLRRRNRIGGVDRDGWQQEELFRALSA